MVDHHGHHGHPQPQHHGPGAEHGRPSHPLHDEPQPQGEVVTVVSESNPHFRLTSKPDGVVLAKKKQGELDQFWVKVEVPGKIDEEGHPAFILVNKGTRFALSHRTELEAPVTQQPYGLGAAVPSILWTQGKDLGHGYTAIRTFSDVKLNLDADHGDKKHGGIKDDNPLVVFSWNKQENQKWKIAPVGPQD